MKYVKRIVVQRLRDGNDVWMEIASEHCENIDEAIRVYGEHRILQLLNSETDKAMKHGSKHDIRRRLERENGL